MVSLDLGAVHEERTRTRSVAWPRAVEFAIPVALYMLALVALMAPVIDHPAQPYNWEPYSAEGALRFWDAPGWPILRPTGGLMTDSGESPLVVLPAWLGFQLGGVGLASMRDPMALITALAPVMLWLAGRRLTDARAALLAAGLLAMTPAFIVYGRTATNVGISVVPALVTVYILARVVESPGVGRWLAALQVALLLNTYAYAPIRFLWLIALVVFAVELALRPRQQREFAVAFVTTLVVLPLVVTLATRTPTPEALSLYFDGRGEHVFALSANPDRFHQFLDLSDEERLSGSTEREPVPMARRLVSDNTVDLANLLLDRNTRPALLDYWNETGQLYAWPLVPFFLLGLAVSVARVLASWRARLLLALLGGLTLPLLLTSQVHVGRLIFALPVVLLLVGVGVVAVAKLASLAIASRDRRLTTRAADHRRMKRRLSPTLGRGMHEEEAITRWSTLIVACIAVPLLAVTTYMGVRDYRGDIPDSWQTETARLLQSELPVLAGQANGALLLDRPEKLVIIDIAELRLALDDEYRFVDVGAPISAVDDPRPIIYYGQLFTRMEVGQRLPDRCESVLYVSPTLVDEFLVLAEPAWRDCERPLRFVSLPR